MCEAMSPPTPGSPIMTMSKAGPHPDQDDVIELEWGSVTMICRVEEVLLSSVNPNWRRITAVVIDHKDR